MTNYREHGPITSRMAGQEIEDSGAATQQRLEALRVLMLHPSSTSAELAEHSSLDRYQIARRLPELRLRGLVENDGVRACGVSRRPAMTWKAKA